MTDLPPLVSCIMPTFERRRFVPLAIDYFLRQDYAPRELVVVDDGRDAVADLMPDDPRIRYLRLERRTTLGEKRNIACEEAGGEVIVHWDDDDWSADRRLTYQVGGLLDAGADVCGLRRLLFYDADRDRGWRFAYPTDSTRPWVAGGTLCYRKDFWAKHRFPGLRQGEDTRFLWSSRPRRLVALTDEEFYVAMIHRGNTSPKNTRSRRWTEVPGGQLRAVLGPDAATYTTLGRTTPPASRPKAPPRAAAPAAVTGSVVGTRHVTVSIPYHGCADHVAGAVESILAQTHQDLTLVVVNDADPQPPWDRLSHIDDPRLVRFDLDANRGRYFADDVVLRATASPYFLVQDADDWSEPDRIARLLAALEDKNADAAVSHTAFHNRDGSVKVHRWERIRRPVGSDLRFRAAYHGLYRTAALERLGGWYGGFRVAYDIFVFSLLLMTGKVAMVEAPLYHLRLRSGSLTSSPETGLRSRYRQAIHAELGRRHAAAFATSTRLAGGIDAAEQIGTVLAQHVPTEEQAAGEEAAGRLRSRLGGAADALVAPRHVAAPAARTPDVYELVGRRDVPWRDWVIGKSAAIELSEHLARRGARRILEAGSGTSTAVLAAYAANHGAEVVSLEHEPRYHAATKRLLERLGLAGFVDLRLAPIVHRTSKGERFPWYDVALDGKFDFFMVDGPPQVIGREGAFFAFAPHRARDWEMWLFDGNRPHEQGCVELWQRNFRFDAELRSFDPTGIWTIRPRRRRPEAPPTPDGLGIGILTGGRLDLLKKTVGSFRDTWPGLLEKSFVVMLVNGPDPATADYVTQMGFLDRVSLYTDAVLPTGLATSYQMAALMGNPSVTHVMNLEDDWQVCSEDEAGLARAQELLDTEPGIGQVRLRHRSEHVLSRHMVTNDAISWRRADDYLAGAAHFTFNPSLLRAADVPSIYPAQDEPEAQARFHRTGLDVAQLSPGLFRHIGGQRSRQPGRRRRR